MCLLTAAAALACLLLAAPAEAMSPRVNVTRKAQVIVRGRVASTSSSWDKRHRLIYTYTKLRVENELKGRAPQVVTIRQPGGKVGRLRLIVSDQPQLAAGEQVRAYLTRENTKTFDVVDGPAGVAHLGGPTAPSAQSVQSDAGAGYLWDGTQWNTSDLPMRYWINTSFNSTERGVIQESFSTWQDDPGSSMEYQYMGTTSLTGPSYDSHNVMTKGSTGGSIATTYYWADDVTKRMIDVDIVFDYTAWPWSTSGAAGRFDLQDIATHEAGHTLVLGDIYPTSPGYIAADAEMTMFGYALPGETKKRTIEWGDKAGIAAIYPDTSPPPEVTGFTATPGDGEIHLSWQNPSVSDFAGVQIVRKTGSAPADRSDGTLIYTGGGTTWTDPGLTNETVYYYRIFTFDLDGHYSSGVTASTTPRLASSLAALATPRTITWGGSARITTTLEPTHSPAPPVSLQQSANAATWGSLAPMSWDMAAGAYEVTVSPTALTYYRAAWSGDADHLPATSTLVKVRVRPKLLTALSTRALAYGRQIRVYGYVYPRHDGGKVGFYYERYYGGAWKTCAARYARLAYNSSTRSRATSTYAPSPRDTWRVRFTFGDADHSTAVTYSPTFTVR